MSRSSLVHLRPRIETSDTSTTTPIEQFQNSVLRPVIKFQHDWFVTWGNSLPNWKMICSFSGKKEDFLARVSDYFSKQQDKKGIIIGAVVGLMSSEELAFYFDHEKELNKRIIQMVVQRLTDTFYVA